MSPQRKRKSGWKPPRDRHEVVVAVLAALTIVVVTFALIWFLRPNRNSGSSPVTDTVATPTTAAPGAATPATTAPAAPSTT